MKTETALEHHATPQQAIYATKIFIPRSSGVHVISKQPLTFALLVLEGVQALEFRYLKLDKDGRMCVGRRCYPHELAHLYAVVGEA